MAKVLKSVLLILVIAMGTFLVSCEPEKKTPVNTTPSNGVVLNFVGLINGENMTSSTKMAGKFGGELFSVTNWSILVSHLSLVKENGDTVQLGDGYQWVNFTDARTSFKYLNIPEGDYKGISFMLGLDSLVNHGDPNKWPADHPLNAFTTGLHWGWSGGYIFQALDGNYAKDSVTSSTNGFSFHAATDQMKTMFNLPFNYTVDKTVKTATIECALEKMFASPNPILLKNTAVSHSESPKEILLMKALLENAQNVYKITKVQ
jgi:hypothetical protein